MGLTMAKPHRAQQHAYAARNCKRAARWAAVDAATAYAAALPSPTVDRSQRKRRAAALVAIVAIADVFDQEYNAASNPGRAVRCT
jgi:hypothetical protein